MPRLVLPGHRYIGPGNSVRSGQPIDTDDAIAREHDLLYEVNSNRDVSSIDAHAVDDFLSDFSLTGNWHSLIGGVGLQVKRQYESVFGQQYPAMSKRRHGGQEDYAYAVKQLKNIYRDNNPDNVPWSEFQKLHFGSLLKEARDKRGYGTGVHSGASDRTNQRDTRGDADAAEAGPSNVQSDSHIPVDSVIDSFLAGSPSDDAMAQMDVETMETLANPSKGGGTSSGRSGGGHGVGMIVGIPRNPKTPYVTRTYTKNWIFFSYGFKNSRISINDVDYWCTPLSLIPVDILPFYMDPTEFTNLTGRTVAVSCRAKVVPLGCRMNFQTSATDNKWATSEFVAIGQSAIGLNTVMPGKNRVYNPVATRPMEVESTTPPNIVSLDSKLYGNHDNAGAINLVPRHLNLYFCGITATQESAGATSFSHKTGAPKIDGYTDRWLVNTAIGQPIIDYHYIPKNGLITDNMHSDANNEKQIYRIRHSGLDAEITTATTNTEPPSAVPSVIKMKKHPLTEFDNFEGWTNFATFNYYQNIEEYSKYKWNRGHIEGIIQPQVHVGLTAVPAINPGSEQTDFQNASIYWQVSCELICHEYTNSCFHRGHSQTYDINYYPPSYIKKYHSGLQFSHFPNLHPDHQYSIFEDEAKQFEDISPEELSIRFPSHDARRVRNYVARSIYSHPRYNVYKRQSTSRGYRFGEHANENAQPIPERSSPDFEIINGNEGNEYASPVVTVGTGFERGHAEPVGQLSQRVSSGGDSDKQQQSYQPFSTSNMRRGGLSNVFIR